MDNELRAAFAAELRRDLWPDEHFEKFADSMKADVLQRADELAGKLMEVLAAHNGGGDGE